MRASIIQSYRYVGPFKVLHVNGRSCTLQLPPTLQTHPTFYVKMLNRIVPLPMAITEVIHIGANILRHWKRSFDSRECERYAAARRTEVFGVEAISASASRGHASTDSTLASAGCRRTQSPLGPPSSRRGSEDSRSRLGRPPNAARGAFGAPPSPAPHGAAMRLGRRPGRPSAAGADERHHQEPPPLRDSHGNQFYHVESLLKQRGEGLRRELLVKWRGYPTASNIWESRPSMVADVPGLVAEFDQRQGRSRHR